MRALDAALTCGIFDRAYLFHGDDEFQKEERVRALVASATVASTRDFNLDVQRGGETDAPSLVLALNALPVMAEPKQLHITTPLTILLCGDSQYMFLLQKK